MLWEHPLPSRWIRYYSNDYNEYYYINKDKQEDIYWNHPLTPYYRQLLDIVNIIQHNNTIITIQHLKYIIHILRMHLVEELDLWHGPIKVSR